VANTLDFISQWGLIGFIRWTNNNQEDKIAGPVGLGPMGWNLSSNQTVVYSEARQRQPNEARVRRDCRRSGNNLSPLISMHARLAAYQ
jgi:hypothetical protein